MNEPTKICVLRVFFANEKSYVISLLRYIQLIRHHEKDFLACFFLSKCFIEDDFSHLYPIIFCPIGKYLFWEILRRFQPLELCEHFCWHSKSWQVFCHCESYLTKKQLLISFPTIIEKDKLHCKVCCNKLLEKWGTQYMTLFFPLPCPKLITCRHGAFSGSWVKTETFLPQSITHFFPVPFQSR